MHFTYNEAPCENDVLGQGDILRRTPELEELLRRYYPYFGDNDENQFFLVITQSCDLVPRNTGVCKANYIELAAVRPLNVAIERELDVHAQRDFDLPFTVAGLKSRAKIEQFLERLFNNNEQNYFFLRNEPTAGLPEDCCAFLHLTVPIKSEHYKICLESRILTLNTVFQAKLGWLVGQIYARVGTNDWDPKALHEMVQGITNGAGAWIDDRLLNSAREVVRSWKEQHPDAQLTEPELKKLIAKLPKEKDLAIDRLQKLLSNSALVNKLTTAGAMTDDELQRLLKQISSDQQFSGYFN
jgi:hypothetical protein